MKVCYIAYSVANSLGFPGDFQKKAHNVEFPGFRNLLKIPELFTPHVSLDDSAVFFNAFFYLCNVMY